jgi:hypothetical protein
LFKNTVKWILVANSVIGGFGALFTGKEGSSLVILSKYSSRSSKFISVLQRKQYDAMILASCRS